MARLLVIDDDHTLGSSTAVMLRRRAHEAIIARDQEEGLTLGLAHPSPDIIILGLAPPRPTGYELLQLLRERGYQGAILVTSGSADEAERVRAFRLGADQYVTTPVGEQELLARVDSLMARAARISIASAPANAGIDSRVEYYFGDVVVEPATRQVYRGGKPVKLAPLEFELLVALLRRQGAATPRRELLREVWKYGPDVMSRTLDTHILNLREKLEEEPSTPRYILTVRKLGYRLHC